MRMARTEREAGPVPALMTWLMCALAGSAMAAENPWQYIEADWLQQARARMESLSGTQDAARRKLHRGDAAGAVDGVKDGKYAFHTGQEPNPWWQVDLGKQLPIARLVVYNRLDYAPGLHNADHLLVLTSDNGKDWTRQHENRKHFGGITGAEPLEVVFAPGQLRTRFVRLQIASSAPVFFHLDEVEIYGPADPGKNLALRRPADQSSTSQWSTVKVTVPERPLCFATEEILARGRRLADDLAACGVDVSMHRQDLDRLTASVRQMSPKAVQADRGLYFQVRTAVRRLVFANPLLDFDQLVFVKRFTQKTYPDICLNHMPWVSRPGGDICVLTNPFSVDGAGQVVRKILNGVLGPGHVHGMDLWWGADRVVFGYAKSKTGQPVCSWPPKSCQVRHMAHQLRETEEPTHLFEIGIDGRGLRQLTNHDYWSDLDPTYLPSGAIAFVSERCGYSLQCNHNPSLDETSCNLYVMCADGSDIRRLSASKDGDYLPHCLDDGTIGYTRWEYQERGLTQIQSLWTVRPDGTWADALFKQHLDNPWALEDVRSIPGTDNRKLVAIAAGHHTLAAGPVVVITPAMGMNAAEAIRIVTPGVTPPEGGMAGTPTAEGGVIDNGGHYMTPWALSDKYFLVSYSYDNSWPQGFPEYYRGEDETGYALYLIDVFGNKELIYRDPEISSSLPIPLRPRPKPPILQDLTDHRLDYATCTVSNVSYGLTGIDPTRIRYLRIAHGVPWPYERSTGGQRYEPVALSTGTRWTPVRVLGTVPIEADGSAHFRVPVDLAVYFQLLDENHMELQRMRSFISFQPGEVRGCVGCHESRAVASKDLSSSLALQRGPSVPVPPPWGERAVSFLRDVQPVFDRHCVACHGGLKPAAGLDFSAGLRSGATIATPFGRQLRLSGHNTAYHTLLSRHLVSYANKFDPASAITRPMEFGSHRSKLVHVLREGSCGQRVQISRQDWLRLVTWVDANVPYHDSFLNTRADPPPYDLPADRDLAAEIIAVHTRRCAACHQPETISRLDWIDLHQPERSLFLVAPLAKQAGSGPRCNPPTYANTGDPDYQKLLRLVQAAVRKAWSQPRRDLRSYCRQSPGD